MEDMSFEELQQIVSVCIDELVILKEENARLREQLTNTEQVINTIMLNQKEILKNNITIADNQEEHFNRVEKAIDNLKYELNDPKQDDSLLCYPTFYALEDTINDIVNHRSSMARFGDGEFAIMANIKRHKFQHVNEKLAIRLKEILDSNKEGFLVAIADNYGSLDAYNEGGKAGIRCYMTSEVRAQHASLINTDRIYHNAYVSRPYALFADNMTDAPRKRFDALKRIWDGRKVIFIEGYLTRLGVGNDLFDNVAQIQRIEAPPTNAFDKYDDILKAALKFAEEDTLFLIALGPTAGVLAYDLYEAGYQALDIGHVDLEYEWYLGGTGKRCEVKHKYNNEYPGGDVVEEIQDENYLKQIVFRV